MDPAATHKDSAPARRTGGIINGEAELTRNG
jgi:hypothetical protein